jgi:hypothetical protein
MATSNDVMTKGYNAAAALTKYRAVKFSAAETVTPVTAATDVACGVVQNTIAANDITVRGVGAQTRVMGASLMEAAGIITIGALVTINASGQAKAGAAGERVIGMCVEAASGAGKYARVQLLIPGFLHP